jgi:hypothetical protein
MRARQAWAGAFLLGAALISTSAAAAEPPSFSLWVDRGFGLPAPMTFGILSFTATHNQSTAVEMSLSGAAGLTERLGASISIGSIQMAPSVRYHSPQLGLFYTFVDTPPLELDVLGNLTFDVEGTRIVEQAEPGALVIARVPHYLRFDIGAYVPVTPETTVVGLRAPLSMGFQLAEHFHTVLASGLTVADIRDIKGTGAIPAGVTIGYSTMLVSGAGVGVGTSLTFPEAVRFGPRTKPSPVQVGLYLYVVPPS